MLQLIVATVIVALGYFRFVKYSWPERTSFYRS